MAVDENAATVPATTVESTENRLIRSITQKVDAAGVRRVVVKSSIREKNGNTFMTI
jgi:hypothetical protein